MLEIKSRLDVEYSSASAQRLDLYWPTRRESESALVKAQPLVCFVHGGAWRREDKSEHAELAIRLVEVTGCPVVVPNYRLTPRSPTPKTQLHHPAHAEDILASLEFLIGDSSPVFDTYDKNVPLELYLIGHSCSAHMLTATFLDSSHITPPLTPSPALLSSVKAIAMSEGIYDIDLLVKNFPAYERAPFGFIANTFGDRTSSVSPGNAYAEYSTLLYPARQGGKHLKWLVVHSKGDSLVDFPQSQGAVDHLVSEFSTNGVRKDFETITEEHNEMLRTKEYSDLIGGFILESLH